MTRRHNLFIMILILFFNSSLVHAEGYETLTPAFSPEAMRGNANPLDIIVDKALGQVKVNWPIDTINFSQIQGIMNQYPGMDKINIEFPNKSQLLSSPMELLNMNKQFLNEAANLGFGVDGGSMPEMAFSSIASAAGVSADAKSIALFPITNLKNIMGETLQPVLKQMRYEEMSLSSYLPDWVKNLWISLYNFVMPYYTATVSWVSSFF